MLKQIWAKIKKWIALKKVRSIAKCYPNAIPIWSDWIGDRIVGLVLRRTDDPTYQHICHGILVLSARMDWEQAIENICRYVGCSRRDLPHYPLRGTISADIILLKRICEVARRFVKA